MDSYCAFLWRHVINRPDGEIKPCCRWNGPLNRDYVSVEQAWTSPEMESIRNKMRAGEPVSGCEKCYVQERAGKNSLRNNANRLFGDVRDTEPVVESIEVALGNLCNNACVTCSSTFSTKWAADEKALGLFAHKQLSLDFEKTFTGVDLSRVRYIRFLGGEPMLYEDKIIDIIEAMAAPEIIDLSLNTTLFPSDRLLAALARFRRVEISASVDAVGARNDYIRHGSRWEAVDAFTRRLVAVGAPLGWDISVHSVVQVFNALVLDEIEAWVADVGARWSVDTLTHPAHLDVRFLPDEIKDEIDVVLARMRTWKIADTIGRFLRSADGRDATPFLERTRALDRLRHQSFEETFPELRRLLNK